MRRLHALIHAWDAKKSDIIKHASSLRVVLFRRILHNTHLVRRQEILDHEKNFRLLMRSKGVTYFAWPYFPLYFGMPDTAQRAHCVSL